MRSRATASTADESARGGSSRREPSFARRARLLTGRARAGARGQGRLAAGVLIVAVFYAVGALADFVAPYEYGSQSRGEPFAPAASIHFFDDEGRFRARPFIRARRLADPLSHAYTEDAARDYPLVLFARGYSYNLLGLLKTDRHLFGVASDERAPPEGGRAGGDQSSSRQSPSSDRRAASGVPRVNLLGTDKLGRDRFSRLVRASRFSLMVAPLGALLAGALGVLIGCVAGYAGRKTDAVLMRAADAMLALPELVLILAARAALPLALPTPRAAAFLVAVFVALGWAEMSRLVRGLVMELRGREFVMAARSLGMTEARVLFRHVLPNASRAVVVQLSLMVPAFLLAETTLSFLGVGVQDPDVSWGVMLADANSTTQLAEQPLLVLAPAFAIFLFVLGVRLASGGLRRVGRD